MVRAHGGIRLAIVVLTLMALAAPVAARGRERYQLKLGAFYDQGDFGTSETTRHHAEPSGFKQ